MNIVVNTVVQEIMFSVVIDKDIIINTDRT